MIVLVQTCQPHPQHRGSFRGVEKYHLCKYTISYQQTNHSTHCLQARGNTIFRQFWVLECLGSPHFEEKKSQTSSHFDPKSLQQHRPAHKKTTQICNPCNSQISDVLLRIVCSYFTSESTFTEKQNPFENTQTRWYQYCSRQLLTHANSLSHSYRERVRVLRWVHHRPDPRPLSTRWGAG